MTDITSDKKWVLCLAGILAKQNGIDNSKMALGSESDINYINAWKRSLKRDWDVSDKETLVDSMNWLLGGGHRKGFSYRLQSVSVLNKSETGDLIYSDDCEVVDELALVHKFSLKGVGVLAWDVGRAIFLLRQGFYVGYIEPDEAWAMGLDIAKQIQPAFSDWYHYGVSYVTGKYLWQSAPISEASCAEVFKNLNRLIGDPDSDWNQIPWNIPLG